MSHRILIVDDSALIRRSIRDCIEQNTDWEVCGEAENGRLAVESQQLAARRRDSGLADARHERTGGGQGDSPHRSFHDHADDHAA